MSLLKFTIISICSAFISVSALATPTILGNWGTVFQLGTLTVSLKMNIEQNVTHMTSACDQDGKHAEVSIDVPTKIEGNQYISLASVRNEVNQNGLNCNIESMPGSLTFSVTDTSLTFEDPNLGKFTLNRMN